MKINKEINIPPNEVINQIYTNKKSKNFKTLHSILNTLIYSENKLISNIESHTIYNNVLNYQKFPLEINNETDFKNFLIGRFNQNFYKSNLYSQLILSESYCQYCYSKDVNALDHFIEKGKHPELSISTINLVPICSNCNSKKNNNSYEFVYPYVEELKKNFWLKCDIKIGDPNEITFKVLKNNKIPKNICDKLKDQLKNMDAINSFIQKSTQEFHAELEVIKTQKNIPNQKKLTLNSINIKRESYYKDYNINNYIVVLYDELINKFDYIWANI